MAPSGGSNPPSKCLFLPELPPDLSDEILQRHFRGFVGFSTCRTRHDRTGKLVGFVEFEEIEDAVRCRDSMQGTSPFPGISWHIHFSNNTKGGPPGGAPPKRPREESMPPVGRHEAQRPSYGSAMMPPPPRDNYGAPSPQTHMSPHAPPQHYPPSGYGGPPPGAYAMSPHAAPPPSDPSSFQPQLINYAAMHLPPDATSTLYIEGLPSDATEREVSHLFRRYDGMGFQSIRMRAIESSKAPGTSLQLCFAEFDNAHQATIALSGMQGYRFDVKAENSAIRVSYAKSKGSRGPPPPRAPPPSYDGGFAPREPPRGDDRRGDDRGGSGGGGGGAPYMGGGDDRYDDDRGRDDRQGGYDDDRGRNDYDDDRGRGGERGGYRRDAREHHDGYREDYEDSEVGDNDVFQRAEQVSMHGITDT